MEARALLDELEAAGTLGCAGGREAVLAPGDGAATGATVGYWADIVRDRAARRRLALAARDPGADPDTLRELAAPAGRTGRPRPIPGVPANTVAPQRVAWLSPGRIPLGRLTVLDGDPGLGKSTVTLDLAARVTTGRPMPNGAPGVGGGVVILSAEDGVADTIRPRLDAAGAACARVRVVGVDHALLAIPGDLPELERAIADVGPVLVVVDPLSAYLGATVNSWRDQDVRRALGPLAGLTERTGAAIVVVRHLTESGGASPLYRGGGSIGIIGAARSGLLVAPEPDDDARRVLAPRRRTSRRTRHRSPSGPSRLTTAALRRCGSSGSRGPARTRRRPSSRSRPTPRSGRPPGSPSRRSPMCSATGRSRPRRRVSRCSTPSAARRGRSTRPRGASASSPASTGAAWATAGRGSCPRRMHDPSRETARPK